MFLHRSNTPTSGLHLTRKAWNKAVSFAVEGALFPDSYHHGEDHWRAVATQGLELVEICDLGAKGRAAAALFGLFHDCRRINDDWDPEHGSRGAEAFGSCSHLSHLDDVLRQQLQTSMVLHDGGQTTDDPIIGLGWDADRSVLTRVDIEPAFGFFSCVPEDRFNAFVEAGYSATREPLTWDAIYARAFQG